jgi:hypothetical protein
MVKVYGGVRGAHVFKRRQHADGTWGEGSAGDVESTAAAVRALLALESSTTQRSVRAGVEALLRGHRTEQSTSGRGYSGWEVSRGGELALWTTYYAAQALIDFVDAHERQRRARKTIRLRPWRKTLLACGAVALGTAIVGTILMRPTGAFTSLTIVASVASLVGAYPVLAQWSRRAGARFR